LQGVKDQLTSNDEQQSILFEELDGMRTLASKGLAPMTRVRGLERELSQLRGENGNLNAMMTEVNESLAEIRSKGLAIRKEETRNISEELRATNSELTNITPELQALRKQLNSTTIRSPASGSIVASTVFTEGGVISPGQTLMEIVPQEDEMVVEAQLSPSYADDMEIGMEAEIRFSGVKSRGLPIIHGNLNAVSADVLNDERSDTPHFLVRISVPDEELQKLVDKDPDFKLQPGLPVDAIFPLQQRTALEYLTEPLASTVWQSFREQ
jgi:HlyD family secretion protein